MTLYIVGCVISLMLLFGNLAWMIATEKLDKSDIMVDIFIAVLVSFLSWTIVFIVIVTAVSSMIDNKRKK